MGALNVLRAFAIVLLAIGSISVGSLNGDAQARQKLVVLSIDGLDWRYLRDADRLGLKIPTIRRFLREGEVADGVLGAMPTVTWPSHTTLITGVEPARHGILGNRRPRAEGGDYYWTTDLLKVRTLWHATRQAGLTSAAITWPVTVNADIDWNLPEYFVKRRGGGMDLPSIASKTTPGLVDKIAEMYPSFRQEWMDDRTRTLATLYLMRGPKPDLTLVHFVDLDSEAHDNGPFTVAANAILEYTDELIGAIVEALPTNAVVALVSDHGFERTDRVINVPVLKQRLAVSGPVDVDAGLLRTTDATVAAALRSARDVDELGVGREVPLDEFRRFMPGASPPAAAFEPDAFTMFGQDDKSSSLTLEPREKGGHYLWPGRPDYRATFVLWGPGIRAQRTPEIPMTSVAARFASILQVSFTPGATER